MAEFPILPLYTDSLLSDTAHLSTAEFGAYVRLLITLWRHGGRLKNDEAQLARIAGTSVYRWRKLWPAIRPLLTIDDQGHQVSQQRLTKVLHQVRLVSSNRKRANFLKSLSRTAANGGLNH